MEKKKIFEMALDLTVDRSDYMSAFRKNVFKYVDQKDITLNDIAEAADIPFSTLRTFLYGTSADCKLSTAVKLARAFGVSIDELVGAGTIEDETRLTIAMARTLKPHHRHNIRIYAKHQYLLHRDVPPKSKQVSVLLPECKNGFLKTTNINEALNIDHLEKSVKAEAYMGLKIPCDHYEPYFLPGEILILGAHREGLNGEKCVVSKDGNMYICKKNIFTADNKKVINYMALTNSKLIFDYEEIEDRIGYVIGFLTPDGEWGER